MGKGFSPLCNKSLENTITLPFLAHQWKIFYKYVTSSPSTVCVSSWQTSWTQAEMPWRKRMKKMFSLSRLILPYYSGWFLPLQKSVHPQARQSQQQLSCPTKEVMQKFFLTMDYSLWNFYLFTLVPSFLFCSMHLLKEDILNISGDVLRWKSEQYFWLSIIG